MPSRVAEILLEQGRLAAAARERSGQIWGNLAATLGQVPGQIFQQHQADVQRQQQQQARDLQAQVTRQDLELGAGRLREQEAGRQDVLTTNQILSDPTTYNPDGTLNRESLRAKIASHPNAGHLLPKFTDFADHLEETTATLAAKHQALAESQRETLGKDALQIEALNNDPGSAQLAITERAKPGPNGEPPIIPQAKADAWLKIAQTPTGVASLMKMWKAGTKAGELDLVMVPPGTTPLDKRTGKPLEGFTPQPKPPTEAELDAAQQARLVKIAKGTATPDEITESHAYESRKRTVSDPALVAAADRQASAQAQQNALQKRTQDFQNLEKARTAVDKEVNQPFATAQASAEELRSLVRAAQGGNKIAASLQSLQTAASVIRANGLNRINMAEIAMPATAGSIVDRFLNLVGKATGGQPVDEPLQRDMLAVADVIERGAYDKAIKSHKAITDLYEVPQLKPTIQPPASVTAPPNTTSGAGRVLPTYADLRKRKDGQ